MIWETRPVICGRCLNFYSAVVVVVFSFVSSSSLGDLFYVLIPYLSLRVHPTLPSCDDRQGGVT